MKTLLINKFKNNLDNSGSFCLNLISNPIQLNQIQKEDMNTKKEMNILKLISKNQLELKMLNEKDLIKSNENIKEFFEKKKIVCGSKPINEFLFRSSGLHNLLQTYLESENSLNEKINKDKVQNKSNQMQLKEDNLKEPRKNKFLMKLFKSKIHNQMNEHNLNAQPQNNALIRFISYNLPQKEINVIKRCLNRMKQESLKKRNSTKSQWNITKSNTNRDNKIEYFDNNKQMLSFIKSMKSHSTSPFNATSLVKLLKQNDNNEMPDNINESNINTDSINNYIKAHQKHINNKYDSTDLILQSSGFLSIDSKPQIKVKKKCENNQKKRIMRLYQSEIFCKDDEANKLFPKRQKNKSISNILKSNKQLKTLYVGSLSHFKRPFQVCFKNQGDILKNK